MSAFELKIIGKASKLFIALLVIIFFGKKIHNAVNDFMNNDGGGSPYENVSTDASVQSCEKTSPCVSADGRSNPLSGTMIVARTGSGGVNSGRFARGDSAVRVDSHGNRRNHNGIDYAAEVGTPVYAVTDGKVSKSTADRLGYGTQAILVGNVGGKSYSFNYAHLDSVVASGDVKKGDLIGYTGRSGNAADARTAHLHFEVREGNYADRRFVNPESFLNGTVDPTTGMVTGIDCSGS